jgi:hypothetical protein
MGKPSKAILDFMEKFSVTHDEVWEVRSGGAWAIKHSALERVAAEQGISFHPPDFIESKSAEKIVAMCVAGKLGGREEWSVGEASPANNKNAYCYAMAEKRAKDRVILKLLNSHGTLYSEDEADDFKRPNPHVTRPADIVEPTEYDQYGQPVDNIPLGDETIERLPKSKARADFEACQKEMRQTQTARELEAWGAKNANRIATYPNDWAAIMRGLYTEHMSDLRTQGKAA